MRLRSTRQYPSGLPFEGRVLAGRLYWEGGLLALGVGAAGFGLPPGFFLCPAFLGGSLSSTMIFFGAPDGFAACKVRTWLRNWASSFC